MPPKISLSRSQCPLGAVGIGGVGASLSPLPAVPKTRGDMRPGPVPSEEPMPRVQAPRTGMCSPNAAARSSVEADGALPPFSAFSWGYKIGGDWGLAISCA